MLPDSGARRNAALTIHKLVVKQLLDYYPMANGKTAAPKGLLKGTPNSLTNLHSHPPLTSTNPPSTSNPHPIPLYSNSLT